MTRLKHTLLAALPVAALVLSSCSAAPAATSTPEAGLTVEAPSVIVAEGRLEPIRYAELALNTSGLVSEVLHKEGDVVQAGEVIARMENAQARTLETAQADALKAITAAYQAVRELTVQIGQLRYPG